MRQLNSAQRDHLHSLFANRVSFDPIERRLYSHDVGVIPALMKPLVGDTTPAAVVQPQSEAELIDLVQFARREHIPLVPRGRATSGYGGVLPVQGGIVVEFTRMKQVIRVDPEAQTVTVEPGIVWKHLESELNKNGLSLRTYPTSFPSSTVGGWLAQGGAGIGGYQYGWFRDNVLAARVVLPDGQVKEFRGDQLDLISDAEGITGFITQVTLQVRQHEPEVVSAASFAGAAALVRAVGDIARQGLPLWSASFMNPKMAELKNQLPPRTHHGEPVHEDERPKLPETYIALFAYPEPQREAVETKLQAIVATHGGQRLSDELATHEWEDRFNPMKVKRLGPSLVPAEVVVPLDRLDAALQDIEMRIQQPLVMEGMVLRGNEVVLLGFIPHDKRSFGFNIAYGLSLTMLQIAKRHGGRPYGTGFYFTGEAPFVLGVGRAERLRKFKTQVDPQNLLNPGKVVGDGIFGKAIGMAARFEPVVSAVANLARSPLGERPGSMNGYPADVSWYAYACAQCGYCVDECTLYQGRQWESASPRGKWFFLQEVLEGKQKWDQETVNTFLLCTTCEKCDLNCQLDLPIEPSWGTLRGELIQKRGHMTFPAFEIMAASLQKERNIWGGFQAERKLWTPPDLVDKIKDKAEVAYFAGCTASYVEHDIAQAAARLLDKAGVEFCTLGDEESCCGIPMLVAGKWDVWEDNMRRNIDAMKRRGVKTVVTSCPACWLVWHTYYPQWAKKLGIDYPFETKNYTEVLAEKLAAGELKFEQPIPLTVTFHDSCHLGRAGEIYDAPREVIQAIPGVKLVEMEHNREEALCCGSVLTRIGEPIPTSNILGGKRIKEAEATGADAVLALCPCCQFQLRVSADQMGSQMPVKDLAAFAAKSLGIEIPDPTPYALEMWALFEKFINLMTPEGFANLMGTMWPELIDAMPFGMGPMMRMMGKLPSPIADAMFGMMKPMFPFLFPRLLPMMMPKVMPVMLDRVSEKIPMPEFLEEQMPDLMPKVMDNLMPHMVGDVVPLVTQPMIDYLRGKNGHNGKH